MTKSDVCETGCGRRRHRRGLCRGCYRQAKRDGVVVGASQFGDDVIHADQVISPADVYPPVRASRRLMKGGWQVLAAEPQWRDGACFATGDVRFLQEKPAAAVEVARNVCQQCPIRLDCLEWGVAHEQAGVWGGLVEDERRRLRRRRGQRVTEPGSVEFLSMLGESRRAEAS